MMDWKESLDRHLTQSDDEALIEYPPMPLEMQIKELEWGVETLQEDGNKEMIPELEARLNQLRRRSNQTARKRNLKGRR